MLGLISKIILFIVMLNGKYGVISSDNQIIIPFEYDKIVASDHQVFIAKKIVDIDGKKSSKTGALNYMGQEVIPFAYDEIAPFRESNVTTAVKDGKALFINTTNQMVRQSPYEKMSSFNNGLALFQKNGKQGFVNEEMKEVIPAIYTNIYRIDDDLFFAWKSDGGKVIINGKNQLLSQIESHIDVSAGSYQEGVYMTYDMNNNYYAGLRNLSGKQLLDHKYRELYFNITDDKVLAYGRNSVENEYEILQLDLIGNVLSKETFGYILSKDESYFILGDKIGASMKLGVYKDGAYLIDPIYDQLQFVRTFDDDKPIYQDKLIAMKNGKFGLIGLSGQTLIPFVYDRLIYGHGDFYLAKKENRSLILTSGHQIVVSSGDANLFSKIDCNEDAFFAEKNKKWGVIRKDGSWLIPAKYERITHCVDVD